MFLSPYRGQDGPAVNSVPAPSKTERELESRALDGLAYSTGSFFHDICVFGQRDFKFADAHASPPQSRATQWLGGAECHIWDRRVRA